MCVSKIQNKGILMDNIKNSYYGKKYFDRQKPIGEFGGWASLPTFAPYVRPEDTVLDFGCGGGFLLKNINCKKRIGVEINPHARETAKSNGIEVYASVNEVSDNCANVIISNNALEHCHHPLQELQALYPKLMGGASLSLLCHAKTLAMPGLKMMLISICTHGVPCA